MEINSDVGEVSREVDDAILPFVSACNVSCNAHAGDENLIRETVRMALQHRVKIGAHPSWPDRENFGRRSMNLSPEELRDSLRQQILWLTGIVESEGGVLQTVKPHGALYHDAISDRSIAATLINVVRSIDSDLAIIGMAGSPLADDCRESGVRFVPEAFADRRYENANALQSRTKAGAVIVDGVEFKKQLQRLVDGTIKDVQGRIDTLIAETICIHSDTPTAAEFARLAHEFFTA